jgi:hypothetical protein
MPRRSKTWVAPLLAVCLVIIVVAVVQTMRSSGDGANKANALAEITHLFASFEKPPGSTRIAKPDITTLDNPAGGTLTSDHFIDATQYWRFPMAPIDAVRWVEAHPPRGMTLVGGSCCGSEGTQGYSYRDKDGDGFYYANIGILIAGGRQTPSYIRLDATLVWLSKTLVRDVTKGPRLRVTMLGGCPHALGENVDVDNPKDGLDRRLLPKDDPTGAMICSYEGNTFVLRSLHLARSKTLSLREAVGLAGTVNEIRLNYPGKWGFYSCHTGTEIENKYILVFSYARHADADLWYDTTSCGTLQNGYLAAQQYNDIGFFPQRFENVNK